MTKRICFYGDDFTGSLDALLQYQRAGLVAALALRLPTPERLAELAASHQVVGIAGIARSLPTEEIEAEVAPVLAALAQLKPAFLQYKVCSTGDSSPDHGSIGRVLELARGQFGTAPIPILFAQPDFGRYTFGSHHFADEAGQIYRLDHQPTMSNHPVTPMRQADLRVHLAQQTDLPIGYVHKPAYTTGRQLAAQIAAQQGGVLLDAVDDADLRLIGAGLMQGLGAGTQVVIGSGGISTALAHALAPAPTPAAPPPPSPPPAATPVLAVSGSQSPQTARQIAAAVSAGWEVVTIRPTERLITAQVYRTVADALGAGKSVVVHSEGELPGPQFHAFTGQLGNCYRVLITRALQQGLTRRLIVCGGDTSSHLMRALPAETLRIIANPTANVPVCAVGSPEAWLDNTTIVLKGGQVGPDDLFEIIRTHARA